MSTESFRDVLVGVSNRRNQNPDEFEDLSEKRKLVATAKISAEQKSSSLASPKSKSYPDALQDEGKALSEKRKLAAKAKTSAKYKSLSLASQGATSSSSAPAPPPSASAIDLQAEGSVEKVNPCDFANDLDPASHHHKKADTDATTVIDQESVDKALKTKSKPGGNSRKEEEKFMKLEPVNLLDDGKTELECFSTECLKEYLETMKVAIENDRLRAILYIRQAFGKFRESKEGRSLDASMNTEFTTLLAAEGEEIVETIRNVPFLKVLLLTIFQADYTNLKAEFSNPKWRKGRRFPKFSNNSADYQWWKKNFDLEIVQTRLEMMGKVTKNVAPQGKYFLICRIVSWLNAYLHPPDDVKTGAEMAERKKFVISEVDLGPTILSWCSDVPWNKKI